jgi:fructose-bisphosphate aldolase, class I
VNGLERNSARLFRADGTMFVAALDHPQVFGVMEGLVDPLKTIKNLAASNIDGFIVNPGLFRLLDGQIVSNKHLIMRASLGATSMSAAYPDNHSVMVSPRFVLDAGADAVLIMLILGGSHDKESMLEVARTAEQFHEYAIPVIVEVMAADYTRNNETDMVRNGARIAAELGADMVKSFYCDDFQSVVAGCPVPIVLAGGPKDSDIVGVASTVVKAGCKGFAFGRNLFQSDDPIDLIARLDAVLRN